MAAPASAAKAFCTEVSKLPGAARRHLGQGQVAAAWDWPRAMHLVVERGGLALQVLRGEGTAVIVEVLGAGSCMCVGPGDWPPPSDRWSLATLLPTSVLEMPANAYFRALGESRTLAALAARTKARQHAALVRHTAALRGGQSLQRTASAVAYLADEIGEPCPLAPGSRVLLSQEVVAATAQLSRQSANRQLQRLRAGRYVHVSRRAVCVIDQDGLNAVADGRAAPRAGVRPCNCKLLRPAGPLECPPPVATRGDQASRV